MAEVHLPLDSLAQELVKVLGALAVAVPRHDAARWAKVEEMLRPQAERLGRDYRRLLEMARLIGETIDARERGASAAELERQDHAIREFFYRHVATAEERAWCDDMVQEGRTMRDVAKGRVREVQTPTGPVRVLRSVAEALLKNGVISGELDGRLHAADAATVKAGIMGSGGVCDFCSAPGPGHTFDVPDFPMPWAGPGFKQQGMSTDGFAACDACAELVRKGDRKGLLARSVAGLSFGKFTEAAVRELHDRFWNGMRDMSAALGVADGMRMFIEDTLPDAVQVTVTDRDRRVQAASRISGLTPAEVERVAAADVDGRLAAKLARWKKTFGLTDPRSVADLIDRPRPPLHVVPHWQRALDAKFEAAGILRELLHRPHTEFFLEAVNLNDKAAVMGMAELAKRRSTLKDLGYATDLKMLPGAQAYSFSAETAAAILEAAQGIPHDTPLSAVEMPNTGSGWFWFSEPLPLMSSPAATDKTHALLWGWENTDVGPAMMFSTYVVDERGVVTQGKVLPATRWYWPHQKTFHEMLARCTAQHRAAYGPGGPHSGQTVGEDITLHTVAQCSLFFAMACVWFRQTVPGEPKKRKDPVLVREGKPMERHARKRAQKEYRLAEAPTVQVVALRKTMRTDVADAPAERREGARQYKCHWIVQGHPRLQACGPGRKDRKLIWIEAHPAGPLDMPLKTKTKVYAVVR